MPAHSPGKAGRSREPGERSCSNMCFQTEGGSHRDTPTPACLYTGKQEALKLQLQGKLKKKKRLLLKQYN
uniref:Uncharacterized protein n=1 Tax=Amphilophus citrinellus TaxID=61819 RepID=A0A3Q0T691_AMPCI